MNTSQMLKTISMHEFARPQNDPVTPAIAPYKSAQTTGFSPKQGTRKTCLSLVVFMRLKTLFYRPHRTSGACFDYSRGVSEVAVQLRT
jgi:hypothetical protein